MNLQFVVYSRRPLGRLLGPLLALFDGFPPTRLVSVSLTSRHGREDLSRDELIRTAAESSFDTCHIETTAGEATVIWRYGPGRSVPMIFGSVKVSAEEVSALESLLLDLCLEAGSSYAVCDLEGAQYVLEDGTDPYLARGTPRDLYWWNYFGPEYGTTLIPNDRIRSNVARMEALSSGAIVVVTRSVPTSAVDRKKVQTLAAEWPVFLQWSSEAASGVQIDYAEIRSLPAAPRPLERKIADFVGPADAFITSVSEHARRFMEWAAANGAEPKAEEDFRRLFREKHDVILDQHLIPAIAAYGEAVRRRINGEWTKARIVGRGEPVVGRPGRPWSRRRVIYEVLEALQEETATEP